jgi:hypothetical protein
VSTGEVFNVESSAEASHHPKLLPSRPRATRLYPCPLLHDQFLLALYVFLPGISSEFCFFFL